MSRLRDWREENKSQSRLNLTPFMNMVVILIPLLLLSVVFLKIGVINVTSPPRAEGPVDGEAEQDEQLELTVGITPAGFEVATAEKSYAAADGCPTEGPTVCLADRETDLEATIAEVRRAVDSGDEKRGKELLEKAVATYDFAGLYNRVRELKAEHPGETKVRLTAGPDIPYALVVRVMDAVRYELDSKQFASNEKFWRANVKARDGRPEPMFSDPILAVGR